MPKLLVSAATLCALLSVTTVHARNVKLRVELPDLDRSGRFFDRAAFCPDEPIAEKNVSPAVRWSKGPKGTRSYALLMVDLDVPRDLTLINKAGTLIPANTTRMTVYHWILTDIPVTITSLDEGQDGKGVVPHGKPVGPTPHGRRGSNIYTSFFSMKPDLAGTYGGYDGPCPPKNDELPHHYVIRLYALDVATLGLSGAFDGRTVERAMRGHILAKGDSVATYTLNR